jgi:hypothetical protein
MCELILNYGQASELLQVKTSRPLVSSLPWDQKLAAPCQIRLSVGPASCRSREARRNAKGTGNPAMRGTVLLLHLNDYSGFPSP